MDSAADGGVFLYSTPQAVDDLFDNVKHLWKQQHVPVLSTPPSALEFLRDYVSMSRPCIIENAVLDHCGIPISLNLDSIVQEYGDSEITVNVTPDGHGDALRRVGSGKVRQGDTVSAIKRCNSGIAPAKKGNDNDSIVFVKPMEHKMTLSSFRRALRSASGEADERNEEKLKQSFSLCDHNSLTLDASLEDNAVYYYSLQNDCLRTELPHLWQSTFPQNFDWASQAFGQPDAVNLWIGNHQAVSSLHKDHYENLFYVASGEKVFVLYPPAMAPLLPEESWPSGQFVYSGEDDSNNDKSGWKVKLDVDKQDIVETTRWIDDPTPHDSRTLLLHDTPLQRLQIKHLSPLIVKVKAGQMLYLPALWYHQVSQTCETVAVNYWYDMRFDSPSWCYYQFMQQMVPVVTAPQCNNSA